ncbi:MAG: NAD(P)H-dependent oxidoreductase [Gammaproteobacteria bacterium]|nr:NAD(P)H-dependent oxidoreductase [Gammaproteobacteria bacterium]
MNVLIVYAHPEPTSLNGSLKDFSIEVLEKLGHRVEVSDLYAMRWKSQVDADDFLLDGRNEPLNVVRSSKEAYETRRLTEDVMAEQRKLLWADALIFQFPLWWFSMPAILKGWIDRVYAYGFGYGVGEHSEKRWGDRYGEGTLQGKRALLIVTTGGWVEHYSERGINGLIDDILFPINHGVLFYPGFDVLPSFVAYKTMDIDKKRFTEITAQLRIKLENLFLEKPIPYRRQNAGEYNIPTLTLKDGIKVRGQGFRIHQN